SDRRFIRHTKHDPCPKCGGANPCRTFADGATECFRVESPISSGSGLGWLHFADNRTDWRDRLPVTPAPKPAATDPDPADAALRDRAFRFILDRLSLDDADREHLRARGLTDAEIDHDLYRSLPEPGPLREAIARDLVAALPVCRGRVPGLYWKNDGTPTLAGHAGIMIPGFGPPDADGHRRIVGIQLRPSDPAVRADGKYRHFSSRDKAGGCSSGAPVSVSLPMGWQPDGQAFAGEGWLKGNIIAHRTGRAIVSMPGVTIRAGVVPALRALGATQVITTIDNNSENNPLVAQAEDQLVADLTGADLDVSRATWPDMYKGLDDALVAQILPMIAPTAPSCGHLVAEKDREIATLREQLAAERQRYRDLSEFHSAAIAAHRSPHMGPERATGTAMVIDLSTTPRGEWRPMPHARMAEQAGVSPRAVPRHLKVLAPVLDGVVETKTEWIPERVDSDGVISGGHRQTFARLVAEPLEALRVIATGVPAKGHKNGNGGRRPCPKCGDAGVVRKWTDHCAGCGKVLATGETKHPPGSCQSGVNQPETVGVGDCQTDSITESFPSEPVLSSATLAVSHNDEPEWIDTAPPVDEEPVGSVAEAWLAGASLPPSPRLDPARIPLAMADHAADCDQRHRAHNDLAAYLEPLARARGRTSVPKPGRSPGDDPWTW
ncbi:MAG: hypothetical protein M3Q65_04165, partial [Chloroflexota bacterium]|nr:hypothetical protein [Chloroflexota bacterium]